MKTKFLMLLLFCLGFAFTTSAQTATPKITKRQANQKKRTVNGIKTGELTKGEVAQIHAQQKSINRTKKRAKSDGTVTNKERVVIHKRQNNANRNIARKKNNNRNRN
ncbi:MAG: hypothetical protein Sapg2KO_29300 [Saprospiraceae bacterium]